MSTVYAYVMDTMADWELAHVMAELNSGRSFKKDAPHIEVKTVGLTRKQIKTMGGLTITPDLTLDEVAVKKDNMLVLPGSDRWAEAENFAVIELAKEFLAKDAGVAAICGATVALATAGILDNRKHTSNGEGFLDMFCPNYKGTSYYVDEHAVRDDNLITAAGTGGISLARIILDYYDVFTKETLESWYNYFSTGKAEYFFAMMQSIQ